MMTGIFLISKGLDIHRQVKINDKTEERFQNFCSCDFKTDGCLEAGWKRNQWLKQDTSK